MSTPRMCDSQPYCVRDPSGIEPWRRIFSESETGWSTGSMNVNVRNPKTGRLETKELDQDLCPEDVAARTGIKPDLPEGQKTSPAYIGWLESQLQINQPRNSIPGTVEDNG